MSSETVSIFFPDAIDTDYGFLEEYELSFPNEYFNINGKLCATHSILSSKWIAYLTSDQNIIEKYTFFRDLLEDVSKKISFTKVPNWTLKFNSTYIDSLIEKTPNNSHEDFGDCEEDCEEDVDDFGEYSDDFQDVEDVEDVENLEDVDDVGDIENVDDVEDVEDAENVEDVGDVEDVEDVEEVTSPKSNADAFCTYSDGLDYFYNHEAAFLVPKLNMPVNYADADDDAWAKDALSRASANNDNEHNHDDVPSYSDMESGMKTPDSMPELISISDGDYDNDESDTISDMIQPSLKRKKSEQFTPKMNNYIDNLEEPVIQLSNDNTRTPSVPICNTYGSHSFAEWDPSVPMCNTSGEIEQPISHIKNLYVSKDSKALIMDALTIIEISSLVPSQKLKIVKGFLARVINTI